MKLLQVEVQFSVASISQHRNLIWVQKELNRSFTRAFKDELQLTNFRVATEMRYEKNIPGPDYNPSKYHFWYQIKAPIVLITPVIFYVQHMLHLKFQAKM